MCKDNECGKNNRSGHLPGSQKENCRILGKRESFEDRRRRIQTLRRKEIFTAEDAVIETGAARMNLMNYSGNFVKIYNFDVAIGFCFGIIE